MMSCQVRESRGPGVRLEEIAGSEWWERGTIEKRFGRGGAL